MPRPHTDTVQIALRVPRGWLQVADEIAVTISQPGINASRSDALRACIARGIDVFRGEESKS